MRLVFVYIIVLFLIFYFNPTSVYALFPDECSPAGGRCFSGGCSGPWVPDYTKICPQVRQTCCVGGNIACNNLGGSCQLPSSGNGTPSCGATGALIFPNTCTGGQVCCRLISCAGLGGQCLSTSGGTLGCVSYGGAAIFPNNCGNGQICCRFGTGGGAPPPPPRYTISGHVFGDYNGDDIQNGSDPNLPGITLTLGGRSSGTTTTNGGGNYSFTNLLGGNYTVTITLPPGYINRSTVQYQINLNANKTGYNYGIIPVFTISGNVFNDVNKNRIKDSTNGVPETNITSGITITTTGGDLNVNSPAGTYSISNLLAGTYTVSYTSAIPNGYFLIYPLNGPPPQHSITVGPNCNQTVNLSFGSSCSAGNILDANFAISNSVPWMQSYGLNMRLDEGFEDKIPSDPIYPPYASVSDQINAF